MVLLVLPGAVVLQAAAVRKPLLFLHLAKVAAKEQLVPKARGLNLLCPPSNFETNAENVYRVEMLLSVDSLTVHHCLSH